MTPSLDTVRIGVHPHKYMLAIESVEGPHIHRDRETGREFPFTPELHDVMSLREMLHREFDTDAHAVAYNVAEQDAWPLVKKKCLSDIRAHGSDILMPALFFDWDTPGHADLTPELLDDALLKLDALTAHPVLGKWAAMYTTRGGMRLVYVLDAPVPVEDAEQYIAYIFHQFDLHGMPMDLNCKDWTRRFRCPKVWRDGRRTEKASCFVSLEPGDVLPVADLKKLPVRIIPKALVSEVSDSTRPPHDEVDGYLTSKSPTGNAVQSHFFKEAKKALKGTTPFLSLFNPDVPMCEAGNRNDTILKYLGICIPRLIRAIPFLKPQQVYALFHGPVSQLEHDDQDWYEHMWNALLSIWPVEIEKYNEEQRREAEREIQAFSEIQRIAEGMKEWCDDPALDDPDRVQDFVRRHALACVGRFFYPIGLDGHYQPFAISREQIISRIRTTYLNALLPTTTWGMQGQQISMPVTEVQNEYSTPVEVVEMRPQYAMEGTIEDMDGKHPKMVIPMYRRNPFLIPEYNEDVEDWLCHFFGHAFEEGKEWIANALAFEEGAICALSIAGPPSTGKKLLVVGLSECLEKPYIASGQSVIGNFNEELCKTPFLNINEGLPKKQGSMPFSELFKQLTASDPIPISEKYKPNAQIINPMRVIFTANNHDIVMDLVRGKELTPDDRQAVGERLLHFNQDGAAAALLREKGEFAHTGRDGHRWIANGVNPSDFIVAKHFLHLHKEREPNGARKRYLVTGNCFGNSSTLHRATTQKEATADVITALIRMIESEGKYKASFRMGHDNGAVFVTVNAIRTFVETMEEKNMTFRECSQALRNIELNNPQVMEGMEWHEIDVNILVEKAQEWGLPSGRMRALLAQQYRSGYLKA